ncbi:MAG: thiosulfate oxidation carrier protein SoxY, partial [Geminicoccaceae bacterium]
MGWLRYRRIDRAAFLALAMAFLLALSVIPAMAEDDDPWPDIRAYLFEDREIIDGAGIIRLDAPERAEDAAVVPIKVSADLPQTDEHFIEK